MPDTKKKPAQNVPGPCNRCDAHKEHVHGLCGSCGRFPKLPKTFRDQTTTERMIRRDGRDIMSWRRP